MKGVVPKFQSTGTFGSPESRITVLIVQSNVLMSGLLRAPDLRGVGHGGHPFSVPSSAVGLCAM